MAELGGGTVSDSYTVVGEAPAMPVQRIRADLPARILGAPISSEQTVEVLRASGVKVSSQGDGTSSEWLRLVPPTWRPDLVDQYDYVEEVGTKVGLHALPSIVPAAPVGGGLTREQRLRRAGNVSPLISIEGGPDAYAARRGDGKAYGAALAP